MTVSYFVFGKKVKQYRGLYIPEEVDQWHDYECGYAFCGDIPCEECILYPTGKANEVRREYEREG